MFKESAKAFKTKETPPSRSAAYYETQLRKSSWGELEKKARRIKWLTGIILITAFALVWFFLFTLFAVIFAFSFYAVGNITMALAAFGAAVVFALLAGAFVVRLYYYIKKPTKKIRLSIPTDTKDEVLDRAAGHCELCGVSGFTLDLHHKNNDPSDNSPENLIVVCPNCHRKIQG